MTIDISAVPRRVQYSGSAGVGPYGFSFEILAQSDIAVYQDSTLLVLTTDYTVTINVDGTGSVTLVVAATGANTVTIIGNRAIARTTDFVTGGDLLANSLNDELDSLTIAVQQLDERLDRSMVVPEFDTATSFELPSVADRASKYMAFDANGNPTATSGTTSDVIVSSFMETVLDDANAAAARATLGLAIGTNVQAYDAQLDTWSGVTPGTGVAAALAVNVGSAGAVVTNGGALGTPSGGTLTNCTGYPVPAGSVVQTIEATPVATVVTCATAIPYDDTIPQNTEGNEVITVAITPTSATNRLRIEFDAGFVNFNNTQFIIAALFQDSTANALAVCANGIPSASYPGSPLSLVHEMAAGTTSATTFKIRVGATVGTVYVNGDSSGNRNFGGVASARLRVTEIKV